MAMEHPLLDIKNWKVMEEWPNVTGARDSHNTTSVSLSPLHVFKYLIARFGQENVRRVNEGMETFKWVFYFNIKGYYLQIGQDKGELHMAVKGPDRINDDIFNSLQEIIRGDFNKFGQEMTSVKNRLRKWEVFDNSYEKLESLVSFYEQQLTGGSQQECQLSEDRWTDKHNEVWRAITILEMFVPVWGEAFVNSIFFLLRKQKFRKKENFGNQKKEDFYNRPFRSDIKSRIITMPDCCSGFKKDIDGTEEPVKNFIRLMSDERNNRAHGNQTLEPIGLDVWFFDRDDSEIPISLKQVPIFSSSGQYGTALLGVNSINTRRKNVCEEIAIARDFKKFVLECMEDGAKEICERFLNCKYPARNEAHDAWIIEAFDKERKPLNRKLYAATTREKG